MANRYDVQIKVNGQWMWAGVEMPEGRPFQKAHAAKRRMASDPFWLKQTDAGDPKNFRVAQTGFTTKGIGW